MATIGRGKLAQQAYVMRAISCRESAEVAFVLAVIARQRGDVAEARRYAEESIQLFEGLSVESLEDCAACYTTIEGIAVPDLIHADVVRDRFKNIL